MKIQIAGPGCPRCQATEQNVFNACAELNLAANISHVYDVKEYAKLGVKITPAVIVDGKIVVAGKVPTVEELKNLLGLSSTLSFLSWRVKNKSIGDIFKDKSCIHKKY